MVTLILTWSENGRLAFCRPCLSLSITFFIYFIFIHFYLKKYIYCSLPRVATICGSWNRERAVITHTPSTFALTSSARGLKLKSFYPEATRLERSTWYALFGYCELTLTQKEWYSSIHFTKVKRKPFPNKTNIWGSTLTETLNIPYASQGPAKFRFKSEHFLRSEGLPARWCQSK